MCEEFNAIDNERKKQEEKEVEKDKYPWLDDSDERKYMTDGEILEKYINLDNSCLTESEKVQVRDMIHKYREAFSLRDEIGTCPNIEDRYRHQGQNVILYQTIPGQGRR